jgi:prepilin-type N-terminal cleavage/methylation domain-containing protein
MFVSTPIIGHRCQHSYHRSRQQGFTLVELLMVIAVILVLAGITFGISRGVQNAQARTKAKAELAVIAQSLEQFKSANGDYPWINNDPIKLAQSLMGWQEFRQTGSPPTTTFAVKSSVPASGPRSFIDPVKMSTAGTIPPSSGTMPTDLKLIDPWGNDYVYVYDKSSSGGSWENFGYVLFSKGPDGASETLPNTGIRVTPPTGKDVDNIYAGE